MKKIDVNLLVGEGEGLTIEFKERYHQRIIEDVVGFSNSKGGKILLGVNDKGEIVGDKLSNKMKAEIVNSARQCKPSISIKVEQVKNIIIIDVPEGDEKPYLCSSGFYKRFDGVTQKLTPQDIRKILKSETTQYFESRLVADAQIKDISIEKVQLFLNESGAEIKVKKENLTQLLESLKLFKNDRITNAGVMLFGKEVDRFINHCQIFLVAYKGIDGVYIYDKKYIKNDLLTQFNEAMDFLKKHLNVRAEINGPTRIDIPEIPIDALREIIANAIIHRDYTMSGTNIQVEIHEDRIVVFNPGGLPEDFAANMLGKKTFRRNEIVADFFQRMGKVESLGSGIRRINQSLSMAGLRPAEFEVDTFFTVTLWRQVAIGTTQKKTTQKKTTQKKTTQKTIPKDILEILIKSPTATRQEIAHLLGDITADGVKYYLLKLQKNKTIKREGPDKGGRWKVLKEVNDD